LVCELDHYQFTLTKAKKCKKLQKMQNIKNNKMRSHIKNNNCFEFVLGQFQGQAGGRQEVGVEREVQREGALPEPRQDRNVRRG
jgi:hypothetical protein